MTHDELLAHCNRVHYLPYNEATIELIERASTDKFPQFLIEKHEHDHKWMLENPTQNVIPNHSHHDAFNIPF